jgi:hypothetical protein
VLGEVAAKESGGYSVIGDDDDHTADSTVSSSHN